MRVAFDSQAFNMQANGGVSRYFVELVREFARTGSGVEPRLIAPVHRNSLLADSRLPTFGPAVFLPRWRAKPRGWLQSSLEPIVTSVCGFDVFHQTYYGRDKAPRRGSALVTTVHDMIHEKFPEFMHPRDRSAALKRAAVLGSDAVICVSHHTKMDLCSILGFPESRVRVIHHGVRLPEAEQVKPHRHRTPYLLYVGARARYKNFDVLLRAFASSKELRENYSIVSFGSAPPTPDELTLAAELALPETAWSHMQGDDSVLNALYRGAACFVYPSLYEGFGMPLLEAMSLGCPVVCSDSSSLPEVAGDAAQYFDARHSESLAVALCRVLGDHIHRLELIDKGLERARLFTWERAARQTAEVYAELTGVPMRAVPAN